MNSLPDNHPYQDWPIVVSQALIWGDMDAYQHVNNTVFFRYFEDARMAYFERIGVNSLMQAKRLGPILASTRADFKAPLTYPDTLLVAARIQSAQGKKISMQYQVFSTSQQKIAAEGEGLIIYFDYEKQQSCPIPDSILKAINTLEQST